jgi:hypothetical protein
VETQTAVGCTARFVDRNRSARRFRRRGRLSGRRAAGAALRGDSRAAFGIRLGPGVLGLARRPPVWIKGHWERERHGYHWNPSRWEQRDGRWVLERGRWDRGERFARRDRDHDGVPDRFDRAPDNPYRR